jgi:hypothetical protein
MAEEPGGFIDNLWEALDAFAAAEPELAAAPALAPLVVQNQPQPAGPGQPQPSQYANRPIQPAAPSVPGQRLQRPGEGTGVPATSPPIPPLAPQDSGI